MTLLVLLSLATWRVSNLIRLENGPFFMFARLRRAVGVGEEGEQSQLAMLLSCPYCLSVWVAAILFLVRSKILLYTLAASALAIFMESGDEE